jgi:hypothetical protein
VPRFSACYETPIAIRVVEQHILATEQFSREAAMCCYSILVNSVIRLALGSAALQRGVNAALLRI